MLDGDREFFISAAPSAELGAELLIFLLVVFGAAGTLARYGMQGLVQQWTGSTFPGGTLAVNIVGCFLLGGVAQFGFQHMVLPPDWRTAITVGFFGAFTTFSTFSWEAVRMLEDGAWPSAIFYVAISVVGGLLAVILGMRLAGAL